MTRRPFKEAVRWVAFLDGAKTYNNDRSSKGDVKDKFLLGAGFGVRLNFGRSLAAQLDMGFPLGDASTDQVDQSQVYLSVRSGV